MAKRSLIPAADVGKYLACDFETGKLTWLERPLSLFASRWAYLVWNKRYAGKDALASVNRLGYRYGTISNTSYMAHRVVWALAHSEWPDHTDHINGDPSDNRLVNLRDVRRRDNAKNLKKPVTNKSGYVGVSWVKSRNKWIARANRNGRGVHIGYFADLSEAAEAVEDARRKMGYHENHGKR